jgi:hypothetical protein
MAKGSRKGLMNWRRTDFSSFHNAAIRPDVTYSCAILCHDPHRLFMLDHSESSVARHGSCSRWIGDEADFNPARWAGEFVFLDGAVPNPSPCHSDHATGNAFQPTSVNHDARFRSAAKETRLIVPVRR